MTIAIRFGPIDTQSAVKATVLWFCSSPNSQEPAHLHSSKFRVDHGSAEHFPRICTKAKQRCEWLVADDFSVHAS